MSNGWQRGIEAPQDPVMPEDKDERCTHEWSSGVHCLKCGAVPELRTLSGETPRTDAAAFPMGNQMYTYVDADFARQLERELTAALEASRLQAAARSTSGAPKGYKLVKADVLAWLHGEQAHPLTGEWFERSEGDGAFWWRSRLRQATLEDFIDDKRGETGVLSATGKLP